MTGAITCTNSQSGMYTNPGTDYITESQLYVPLSPYGFCEKLINVFHMEQLFSSYTILLSDT